MAAHAAACDVAERLAAVGITDVRILKGCATGHLDYDRPTDRFSHRRRRADPCRRPRPARIARSTRRPIPEPRRRRWQEHYGKSTTVVDEHARGDRPPRDDQPGLLRSGDARSTSCSPTRRAFTIGGTAHARPRRAQPADPRRQPRRRLEPLQPALGPRRAAARARQRRRLAEAVERVERWKVDALFALGVLRAWTDLAVEPHPLLDWAQRHETVGRQRLAMRIVGDRPRGHLLTAPLALPVWQWPGYVGPMLLPSRAYLAQNDKTWTVRMRSLLAELKFW